MATDEETTKLASESEFPPKRVAGRARGWYRGDCHVHTQRSFGGELTPKQLATAAREVGLDFIAITEHNAADTHGAWRSLAGDDLLVILGQEIVTTTGHWLAVGIDPGQVIDWRYGIRDDLIDRAVDQVHTAQRWNGHLEWRTSREESAFVRIEVRHPTGHMAALTNPIILT